MLKMTATKTVSQNLIIAKLFFLLSLSACGMSIGSSAIGTTEFMQQHNHKVSMMLRQTEEASEPTARDWQK